MLGCHNDGPALYFRAGKPEGQPVPFANLVLTDINLGTVADGEGKFTLPVPIGLHTLQISSVGMKRH